MNNNQAELDAAAKLLRMSGQYIVEEKYVEPPHFCSLCGIFEQEALYGVLVDARVIVADGEEGFADITLLLCDDCSVGVFKGLQNLGFKDHRHGGANSLEDQNCPGADRMRACPTPTDSGIYSYIVPGHHHDGASIRRSKEIEET